MAEEPMDDQPQQPRQNGSPTWPTGEEVMSVAQEMYPQAIAHAASEARARKAERLLMQLQEAGIDVPEPAGPPPSDAADPTPPPPDITGDVTDDDGAPTEAEPSTPPVS